MSEALRLAEESLHLASRRLESDGYEWSVDADVQLRETAAELRRLAPMEAELEALRAAVPAIHAGWRLVPVDPTEAMIDAAGRSKAIDDEGAFPSLYDHIDYSGDNKTRMVIREALAAAISASPQAPDHPEDAVGMVAPGSVDALKLAMEASAWDGVLQLDDAIANINDFFGVEASPQAPQAAQPTGAVLTQS